MLTRHASLGALVGALLFLTCKNDTREVGVVGPLGPSTEEVGPSEPMPEEVRRGPLSPASLTLPFKGTTSSTNPAFWITQTGSGVSGDFVIDQPGNSAPAVAGLTNGSGPAVFGRTQGTGPAVSALATGGGRAGVFRVDNPGRPGVVLEARTNSGGIAIAGVTEGTGPAGVFTISSVSNSSPAIWGNTSGTGPGLRINHSGSSGDLAVFQVNSANRIRFTRAGKGIFNGGTQTGGADVAEAMAVEGRVSTYEPGDVLVISTRSDRTVEKAGEPYSTRVIGVYATQPGVLLTERGVDDSLEGLVPVGVVGVIPTKVSAENGPIRRGDLLVSARTSGHAMRANPERLRFGMVLGKALGEWEGPDKGVIPVLINVK